jgi:hypothetical protein
MMVRPDDLIAQARAWVATVTAALSMLMIAAGAGWPQSTSPQPSLGIQEPAQQAAPQQSGPAPSSPVTPAEENPGLFNEMEKLFEKTLSVLPPLKSPRETIDDWNTHAKDAAKDAAAALSRLARPSAVVSGRTRCPVSANGAPDCKLGAGRLCQSKGFKEGNSLDSDAAETCSAKVLIPGRARKPDDCRMDNYVTRAVCL